MTRRHSKLIRLLREHAEREPEQKNDEKEELQKEGMENEQMEQQQQNEGDDLVINTNIFDNNNRKRHFSTGTLRLWRKASERCSVGIFIFIVNCTFSGEYLAVTAI